MDPGAALKNRLRIQRSKAIVDRTRAAIDAWLARRRDADELGQYHTQLQVLGDALSLPLARIRAELDGIHADDAATGDVYRAAATHDRRALTVDRIFGYFREKFDQRDDPALGPLLRAADELTWSLFAQPFKSLRRAPRSAPLPYVESLYSPRAIPRADPPADLRSADTVIAAFLKELPMPLIGLPPSVVTEPWQLALLAHEVGHHVEYDLLPASALIAAFRQLLEAAAPPESADAWALYHHEVFADAFSVAAIGPAAVRVIAELELADEAKMLDSGSAKYPCSAVRIALLAAVSAGLGADAGGAKSGIDPAALVQGPAISGRSADLRARAAAELAAVPAIAHAILTGPLGDAGTLADLLAWRAAEHEAGGEVSGWSTRLRAGELFPEKTLRGPRLIISAAIDAWSRNEQIPDDGARAARQDHLRQSTLKMLTESREVATRAGAPGSLESMPVPLGDTLWHLLQADPAP
ncbi:MAG: hypothetical protein ABJE95_08450 [Byssovorax sp.]